MSNCTQTQKGGEHLIHSFPKLSNRVSQIQLSSWDFPGASNTLSKKVPNQETLLHHY